MSNQREAFNKFCFTADITPSTEHLDIWKAACKYQLESDARLFDGLFFGPFGHPSIAIRARGTI